ncbi:hypothetical protein fh0823_00810 [Francisella halioticida]|uniref:Nicotinamide riboside transporter PnuC n=1 Tax=Francisella halioticida TaxID=549298 RepID=A0ABM6LXT9_9GAMM|nr:hypothetical protein [Francisella halioticida]ASG67475.1 hypothetical protein CDV26_02855 [Francisella halioticida]BCD89942.1 hypothetical protein fh0823_00810 [Francisella halioticida]
MITLNYVIYDCIANVCLLIFAFLVLKNIKFAWILVLASLVIKVFIYGKYGLSSSFIYLSAQILVTVLAGVVWLREPIYVQATKQKKLIAITTSLVVLIVWVGVMYKYINPAILNYDILFGFGYLCYMLFVIGSILIALRMSIGLLFIAVVFISYAVSYGNSAVIIKSAPEYIQAFSAYYWASAICLFIAGLLLVASYTDVKRSERL